MRTLMMAASLMLAGSLFAQDVPMPMPKPGPEHKKLEELTGDFDVTVKLYPGPEAEPITGAVRNTARMILGGFWMESKIEGQLGDQPFVGYGFTGYDAGDGNYVGLWVDSDTPAASMTKGEFSDDMTFTATGEMPTPDGKVATRSVMKITGEDTWNEKVWATGPDGEEFVMLELDAKRAATDATMEASMTKPASIAPSSACTDHHAHLAKLAGTWNADVEFEMGGEVMKSKSKETGHTVCRGLWVFTDFEGDFAGMPFTGRSIMGYDPGSDTYSTYWIESMSPNISSATGTPDAEGRIATLEGPAIGMAGEPLTAEQTFAWQSADKRTFSMVSKTPDGEVAGTMRISYTRAQAK